MLKKIEDAPGAPVSFPFELVKLPGSKALAALLRLRREGKENGFTPVLLGDAEDVNQLAEAMEWHEASVEEILARAEAIDVPAWLAERTRQDPDYYSPEPGAWPTETLPGSAIGIHLDRYGKPRKTVFIAKLPAAHSWEVPAYLKLGGWNDCPAPEYQVAVSRYWHDRYGADIATVNFDTVEYLVERPPATREAAEALAREQLIYCSDIVYQGVETLSNLAATLLDADVWFFWWD